MIKSMSALVKSVFALSLAVAVAAASTACGKKNEVGEKKTDSQSTVPIITPSSMNGKENKDTSDRKQTDFSYDFVRISYAQNGGYEPYRIETGEELSKLLGTLAEKSSARIDTKTFTEKYDEAFFEKGYLVVFDLTFSSGSIQPSVVSVKLEDGTIKITTDGTLPGEAGTDDMAQHTCILALDRAAYPIESSILLEGSGLTDTGTGDVNR